MWVAAFLLSLALSMALDDVWWVLAFLFSCFSLGMAFRSLRRPAEQPPQG